MKSRTKEYNIDHSLATVLSILKRVEVFGHYHPLIKKVEKLESDYLFKIIERPFAIIPLKINYRCKVVSNPSIVHYNISGIPLMKPHLEFKLEEIAPDTTKLCLTIQVAHIPIIASILLNKMFQAEDRLWDEINKTLTKELF